MASQTLSVDENEVVGMFDGADSNSGTADSSSDEPGMGEYCRYMLIFTGNVF